VNKKLLLIFGLALIVGIQNNVNVSAQTSLTPRISGSDSSAIADDQYLVRTLRNISNLISAGQYARAKTMLFSLEKTYGNDKRINNQKKQLYRAEKDFASLKELLLSELASRPNDFALLCQLGEAYFQFDSLTLAKETWEKAFTQVNQNDFGYMLLANYYRSYGFYEEAASVFIRGRNIMKNPSLFTGDLADIYITQRDYIKAVQEYLTSIQTTNDPRMASNISRMILNIYRDSDKPDQILQVVEKAAAKDYERPEYYIILGDIYLNNKSFGQAFESYKKAESLSNAGGLYLGNFIEQCYNNRAYDIAIQAADYSLARMDDFNQDESIEFDNVALLKAKSQAELDNYQMAFATLTEVENKADNNKTQAEAIYTAGEIYADKLNDYTKAAEKFNQVFEIADGLPVSDKARIRLAEFDIKAQKFAEAKSKLDKITPPKSNTDLLERANYLAAESYFFANDYENAKNAYKKVMADYLKGFYVNDCLDRLTLLAESAGDSILHDVAKAAWYHFAGYPDSAIVVLREISHKEDSPVYEYALFYLPLYCAESNDWLAAIEAYERYLTAFPDGVYIDKALYNLAELYYEKTNQPDKADQLLNRLVSEHPYSPLIEKARAYLNKLKAS